MSEMKTPSDGQAELFEVLPLKPPMKLTGRNTA